jgi:hypothetical protein
MARQEKTIEELLQIINNNNLSKQELIQTLVVFLFSIGASLEGVASPTAEEVLKSYGSKPTLGNALMAQALYMKETWTINEGD